MITTKSRQLVTVSMNRSQSQALLRSINTALKDFVRLPYGPDRASLVCVKRALIEAREQQMGELEA